MDDNKKQDFHDKIFEAKERRSGKWEGSWIRKLGKKVTPVGIAVIGILFGIALNYRQGLDPKYYIEPALWWGSIYTIIYLYFEWQHQKFLKEKDKKNIST